MKIPAGRVICAALIATCLWSCSDNTGPDSCSIEESFALQTGNYWVYSNYLLDENGERIVSSYFEDTTVVEGTTRIYGKTAYILVTHGPINSDTLYVAIDEHAAYMLLRQLHPSGQPCAEDRWVVMAQCSNPVWEILDWKKDIESYPVLIRDTVLRLKSSVRAKAAGVAMGSGTFRLNGEDGHPAKRFGLEYHHEFLAYTDGNTERLGILRTVEFAVATGIGIVHYTSRWKFEDGEHFSYVDRNAIGKSQQRELIDYYVQ